MKIFLIGLPGCGKTTLGQEVANRLNRNFVDLDVEIARSEKRAIAEIFSTLGEAKFRELERTQLSAWCERKDDYIMATGGGTPCFFDNIQLINTAGISIFIDTEVAVIARRMLKTDLAKRPLFSRETEQTIGARINKMREERIPFYQQARRTLSGNAVSAEKIVEEVMRLEG